MGLCGKCGAPIEAQTSVSYHLIPYHKTFGWFSGPQNSQLYVKKKLFSVGHVRLLVAHPLDQKEERKCPMNSVRPSFRQSVCP